MTSVIGSTLKIKSHFLGFHFSLPKTDQNHIILRDTFRRQLFQETNVRSSTKKVDKQMFAKTNVLSTNVRYNEKSKSKNLLISQYNILGMILIRPHNYNILFLLSYLNNLYNQFVFPQIFSLNLQIMNKNKSFWFIKSLLFHLGDFILFLCCRRYANST